jgi:hypothetical protein
VWSRLACRDSDPRWPLCRQGPRLAAPSIGRKFGGNAYDLQCKEWCDAFAGDALTLADWLIAEQDDGAWSLRALITER